MAISAFIVALAAAAGATMPTLVVLAAAALTAQLSIGWSNDAFDAPNDRAAGRSDKPVARGTVRRREVVAAAVVALTASVVLGFLLGVWPGLVNVSMIMLGWLYNARLKSSSLSGLLYLLGFGLIPVFSASVLPGHPAPRTQTIVAGALLGLGGHFVNALPDLAGDLAQGVRGLPQRVAERHGPFAVRLTAFVLLFAASAVIMLSGPLGWVTVVVLAGVVGLTVAGLRAPGRTPFRIAIGIAALDTVLLVAAGADLVVG